MAGLYVVPCVLFHKVEMLAAFSFLRISLPPHPPLSLFALSFSLSLSQSRVYTRGSVFIGVTRVVRDCFNQRQAFPCLTLVLTPDFAYRTKMC